MNWIAFVSKPFIYEFITSTVTGLAAYGYVISKDLYLSNLVFLALMALMFAYLFKLIVDFATDTLVSLFTKPTKLKGTNCIKRIPRKHKAAITYLVYASNEDEIEEVMTNMETSHVNNHKANVSDNMIAIYASDTESSDLVLKEIGMIKQLQQKYGREKIYYVHRENKWGRKWGCYQDVMKWLYEGKRHPDTYSHEKYGGYKRDTSKPFFSLKMARKALVKQNLNKALITKDEANRGVVGNINALCLGEKKNCIKYLLISDGDIVWPKGSAREVIAKMAHPANKEYGIFQPLIKISNVQDSLYVKLTGWSRELLRFTQLAFWKVYDSSQFYGKGGIKINQYLKTMMAPEHEVLDPNTRCHDFQESLYLPTALLCDVVIKEENPTNYFQELARMNQWTIGDIQGIIKEVLSRNLLVRKYRYYFRNVSVNLPPLPPAQRKIMSNIIRLTVGPPIFAAWLIGTTLAAIVPGLMVSWNRSLEQMLLISAMVGIIGVPKFVAPILTKVRTKVYQGQSFFLEVCKDIWVGIVEFILSTLIFLQFLYDKPVAVYYALKAIYKEEKQRQTPVWIPMRHMAHLQPKTILGTYYRRKIPTLIGLGIVIALVFYGSKGLGLILRASPVLASFIFGPVAIWYTGKFRKNPYLRKINRTWEE